MVWPTHVFLQAAAGGLAAVIAHMIRQSWTVQPPINVAGPDAASIARSHPSLRLMLSIEPPIAL